MNEILIKVLSVLIITAVITLVLKAHLQEFSFLLVLAVTAVVLAVVIEFVYPEMQKLLAIFEKSGNSTVYFKTAVKALSIAYITGFVADVCRDFGQSALAAKAELVGKFVIFALSVPMMCAVLETALKFADV